MEAPVKKDEKNILFKAVIAALVAGLVFGAAAGAVTGILADNYLAPWAEKTFGFDFGADKEDGPEKIEVIENSATIDVVEKASPAVVSIVITKELRTYQSSGFPFDFFGMNFPFFEQQDEEDAPMVRREIGGGTGFIVSSDGLILTNRHVVSDETAEYTVFLNDDTEYAAEVVGQDPFLDLAVLKIDATDLPVLELGDSDSIQIGQTVIAIGNTLSEFRNTVTRGVVSGINRRVVAGDRYGRSEVIEEAIQTDAAINPGNSGGPLLDLTGRVIGVNTAVSQSGQSVGFAIPINSAKRIVESIIEHGRIVRPWLGVRYALIDDEIAEKNNLPVDYGALIVRGRERTELAVIPGSPADKAGITENDIILEIEGERIDLENPLSMLISKYSAGETVELKVLSKGEEKSVSVKLEEYQQNSEE